MKLLQAENDLLKKKFQLIHYVIEKYQLKHLVSFLCKITGVSRSGYYGYFKEEAVYNRVKRAYLSTIKDAETNEILAYEVSDKITLDIAIITLQKLKLKHRHLTKDAFIHSDQGVHYTSPKFQKLVKKMKLGQSMSRRGNCWDNAPQESFFGHFKDETRIKDCETFEQVKQEVNDYMIYYNHYRGQWNLKKLPPARYRQQLQKVA